MTNQMTITVIGPTDGGLVVYESIDGESALVYAGDHEATSEYVSARMQKLVSSGDGSKEPRLAIARDNREAIGRRLLEITETGSAA